MTLEFDIVAPKASSLIEALRAVGYTVQTAVADLIDNSITAGADSVWLNFHWAGQQSCISISDNGSGMDESELVDAMRAGNRSPLETRSPNDLGRFGLGLKTASFSQARILTVAAKKSGGAIATRRWDLDYVGNTNEWRLLRGAAPDSAQSLFRLTELKCGTVVVWNSLDRIVGEVTESDRKGHDRFLQMVDSVASHLGMVFHQYIGGSRPQLKIFINGEKDKNRVEAWDPFLENHMATYTPSDAEIIPFPDGDVRAKGFVLPHKDRLTEDEFKKAGGPGGWNSQQGFYVYRNRRLLVAGGWLDLPYTNEEQYKLARIRVEIPNSTDGEWAIDVKKSRARPPSRIRSRLKDLADVVRQKARDVFVHRGRRSAGNPSEPLRRVWVDVSRDGKLAYKVDRKHPLVAMVLASCDTKNKEKATEAMLRLLEATVPTQKIWLDIAEKRELPAGPFQLDPPHHVREVVEQLFVALKYEGVSEQRARQRLASMEPFNLYPEFIETLGATKG